MIRPRLNPAFKRFQNLPNLRLDLGGETIYAAPICLLARSASRLSILFRPTLQKTRVAAREGEIARPA
jgi:hypothetical protein